MSVILTLIVMLVLSTVSDGYPHGGASCKTDWNCSLGGICDSNNNTCVCDPWFTGANCTWLNLAHAEINYGFQVPEYYSWGGHCAYNKTMNKYIGFFAFMINHCTLSTWTTNSEIVMTTADQPHGPYDVINYKPIVPPWSHNPYLVNYTDSNKINEWQIWHIGDGSNHTNPKNCTSNPKLFNKYDYNNNKYQSGDTGTFYVQVSNNSLYGPWNQYNQNKQIIINETWVTGVSNPAPYIFDNGTVLLYFSTQNCPPDWGLAPACIGMARSTDGWQGPYQTVGDLPIVHPESEDPSVWRDPRGNFHLFTNVNTYHRRCAAKVPCGGHSWSKDGITWSDQFIGAFGPVIHLKNGTTWVNSYVERPQVYQDENNVPVTFFVGMGRTSYQDSISWAQPFCTKELLQQNQCDPTIPL